MTDLLHALSDQELGERVDAGARERESGSRILPPTPAAQFPNAINFKSSREIGVLRAAQQCRGGPQWTFNANGSAPSRC
jgi:hypothetical protein